MFPWYGFSLIYMDDFRFTSWTFFINRIEKVHEVVGDRLMNSAERQKRRYDISCTFPGFKTGDGVLLQDNRKLKRRSPTFQMKSCGPFTVTGV
jgi:hypothetical protein